MGVGVYEIENYMLMYEVDNERPRIIFHYVDDNGQTKNVNWSPPPENAVFIADLLRNEKPVYWQEKNMNITTSGEEVGEEET